MALIRAIMRLARWRRNGSRSRKCSGSRFQSLCVAKDRRAKLRKQRLRVPWVAMSAASNPLDLRPWLDQIEKLGELRHVRGADWNLELGAISEMNVKKELPPALLFDEIKGYPKGFRVLTCSTSSPLRLSSILRLPLQKTHRGLVEVLRGKPAQWKAAAEKFPASVVQTGAALENVQQQVDIDKFPSPLWHEMDGGRYIGTGCSVVTRDLDSDWINVGTYRVQALDQNHVALDMVAGKHGRIHYEKHKAAGKRFPVVIVLGSDPLGYLISGIEVPFGMCEYNYIGAILGAPVAVVKGEVTGLPFPAASEIVLEGHIEPNDERTEGPFGEFHGYYPGKAGHSSQAGHILSQCGVGAYMSRYSVVVDEDIDPSNLHEVMWAVATRSDPAIDIDIIQRGMGSKNDPMFVAYPYDAPFSSKAILDACRPWDHIDEFPPVAEASRELQDKIRAKWKDLF